MAPVDAAGPGRLGQLMELDWAILLRASFSCVLRR